MRNEHKTSDNPWGSSWGEDEEKRVVINFPVMLRKMWSGSEVQAWISDLPPLYTHPANLTENEVSKYWYNKGHEDGRKLAVVNTLTQARILKVIRQTSFADGYLNDNLIRFAGAILKEASEK